jgi:ABC-2 type transport system ATP-binding protein
MEAVTDGAVVVRGLRKSYGHFEAVRGVDFAVQRGEVFSLLGPNGAGKTTTMEMLEGYRERTSGEAWVLGMDPQSRDRRFRERVGIVLQDIAVDAYLTVREIVARNAGYYPDPRNVDETIDLVGLKEKANSRINKLSGGQQRRLDLAMGIIGNPDLLFLDEPTTGFDPNARRGAWDVIRGLREGGTTILLTTHYMDEAQALADHVAVIAAGEIVAAGTPDTIGGRQQAAVRIRFLPPAGTRLEQLPLPVQRNGEWVEIQTDEPTTVLHSLTGWALDRGLELPGLEVDRPTLEDVYLELTGAAARADAPASERAGTTREGAA